MALAEFGPQKHPSDLKLIFSTIMAVLEVRSVMGALADDNMDPLLIGHYGSANWVLHHMTNTGATSQWNDIPMMKLMLSASTLKSWMRNYMSIEQLGEFLQEAAGDASNLARDLVIRQWKEEMRSKFYTVDNRIYVENTVAITMGTTGTGSPSAYLSCSVHSGPPQRAGHRRRGQGQVMSSGRDGSAYTTGGDPKVATPTNKASVRIRSDADFQRLCGRAIECDTVDSVWGKRTQISPKTRVIAIDEGLMLKVKWIGVLYQFHRMYPNVVIQIHGDAAQLPPVDRKGKFYDYMSKLAFREICGARMLTMRYIVGKSRADRELVKFANKFRKTGLLDLSKVQICDRNGRTPAGGVITNFFAATNAEVNYHNDRILGNKIRTTKKYQCTSKWAPGLRLVGMETIKKKKLYASELYQLISKRDKDNGKTFGQGPQDRRGRNSRRRVGARVQRQQVQAGVRQDGAQDARGQVHRGRVHRAGQDDVRQFGLLGDDSGDRDEAPVVQDEEASRQRGQVPVPIGGAGDETAEGQAEAARVHLLAAHLCSGRRRSSTLR